MYACIDFNEIYDIISLRVDMFHMHSFVCLEFPVLRLMVNVPQGLINWNLTFLAQRSTCAMKKRLLTAILLVGQ